MLRVLHMDKIGSPYIEANEQKIQLRLYQVTDPKGYELHTEAVAEYNTQT